MSSRTSRVGGRADPRRPRAAREGAREGDRLEEGRDHEAHPPDRRRRSSTGERADRGGRRARRGVDAEEPREGARARQRPARRRRSTRGRRRQRHPRARERPVPAHRRQDPEGGPRLADPVGAQGARDVSRHRVAPRGHARGRRRLRQPARADLAALPRARAEDGRQRRAALPRAQGPLRLAVRVRRLLPRRHGRGVDPRPAPDLDLDREARMLRDTIRTSKGQKQQRGDQAAEGRPGVHQVARTSPSG